MRRIQAICNVIMLGMMCSGISSAGELNQYAILDFSVSGGVKQSDATAMAERYASQLKDSKGLSVLPCSEVRNTLKVNRWNAGEYTTPQLAAQAAGQILKIDYIVFGNISKLGEQYRLEVQLFDVKKNVVASKADISSQGDIGKLAEGLESAVNSILPNVSSKVEEVKPGRGAPESKFPVSTQIIARETNPVKKIRIKPVIGSSSLTGILGVEVRYRKVAADLGAGSGGPAAGVRFYFSEAGNSWYAAGGVINRDDTVTPSLLAGYAWRRPSGWTWVLGAGVGGEFNDSGEEESRVFAWDLSLGYEF